MTTVFRDSYFQKHLLPEFTRCVYCNNHYATYYFKLHQYQPSLSLSCKHTKQSISKSTKGNGLEDKFRFDKQLFPHANHMHK